MNEQAVPTELTLDHPPLLFTKFHIPFSSNHVVARLHLTARLEEGMGRKLTLLCAPAGYGKTALVCEWLNTPSAKKRLIGWLSLDKGDNDPIRFWTYICTLFNQLHKGVGEQALSLLRSSKVPPIESILTILVNALIDIPKPFVLVLDDFHLLTTPSIHRSLAFLLQNMPSHMHLNIVSRVEPPLPLARLRAQRQIVEVRTSDLRFTSTETMAFFEEVMELHCSEEDITTLETQTEGWITGLQLAALSLQGCTSEHYSSVLSTFSGSHKYIFNYLTDEVFVHLPEYLQTFLLQTAILENMNASLCDAVTEGTNSQALLEQLLQYSLFLVPLDKEDLWYRYHHLFADFLYNRLKVKSCQDMIGKTLSALHNRASLWYEQQRLLPHAIDHALKSEDFERAARLIEQVIPLTFARGSLAILLSWFMALPETTLRCHPYLCLYFAQVLFFGNQYEAANSRLQDAEQSLIKHGEKIHSEDRLILLGEITGLRAVLDYLREDVTCMTEHCTEVLQLMPNEHILRSMIMLTLGSMYWLDVKVRLESARLTEAQEPCRVAGNSMHIMYIALSYLTQTRIAEGCFHEAMKLYKEGTQHIVERGNELVGDRLYVGMETLLYERNALKELEHYVRQGIHLAQQKGDIPVLIDRKITLSRILQREGNEKGAHHQMQDVLLLTQQHYLNGKWTVAQLYVPKVQLELAQGNLTAAMEWIDEREYGILKTEKTQARSPFACEIEVIPLARACVAQGKYNEALELLTRMHSEAKTTKRMGHILTILVLKALIYRLQGDDTQALSTLSQALKLTEPQGYICAFADEEVPMDALLTQLRLTSIKGVSYINALLAAFKREDEKKIPSSQTQQQKRLPTALDTLSEREIEILQSIAEGMSNQEIAKRMIIAESTVKWHLRNIYSKLNVRNRTQAILKARENID